MSGGIGGVGVIGVMGPPGSTHECHRSTVAVAEPAVDDVTAMVALPGVQAARCTTARRLYDASYTAPLLGSYQPTSDVESSQELLP